VLRDGSRACLLRIREDGRDKGHGEQGPLPVLRGAHLAPNLLDSLALTLE
jgi:hypothetical protein